MKPVVLLASLALTLAAGGGLVIAETATPAPKAAAPAPKAGTPAPAHEHDHAAAGSPAGEGMMCGKMMGGGMGSMSMMGGGMGHMMMMGGAGTKVTVKNVDKGVTMTFTTDDSAGAVRLQKMAEAMRLMHEAMATEH